MATNMHDLALQIGGGLAILVAVIHGAAAERRVFPRVRIEPPGYRRLLRLVWQATTLDWLAVGVLLAAAPSLGSDVARRWIVAVAVAIYSYAGIANAVANRGRHYGWVLLCAVVVLALIGR